MKFTRTQVIVTSLVAVLALSWLLYSRQDAANTAPAAAASARRVAVSTAQVRRGDMDVVVTALGTATARETVTVHSRVDGELVSVHFREGQHVAAGELLAEIDPRPFQIALATLALTVLLYGLVPKGFFPVQDTGILQGTTQAPPSISFAAMVARSQDVTRIVLADPAVASLSSFIGVDGSNATLSSGRLLINLKPHAQH